MSATTESIAVAKLRYNQAVLTRNKRAKGFTLLELLVVLAIMASLLSLTVALYRTDDNKDALLSVAQELRLVLQHKIDQSWLDGMTYGLQINSTQIDFYQLQLSDDSWVNSDYGWQPKHTDVRMYLLIASEQDNDTLTQANELGQNNADKTNETQGNTTSETSFNAELENQQDEEKMDIAFISSGEYTPFRIQLEMDQADSLATRIIVQGDGVNALQIIEN